MSKEIEELWMPVVGYEGLYEVSNFGNVKSLNCQGKLREKLMNLNLAGRGYYQVGLSREGETKKALVHRLVAQAFIPNYMNLEQVDHINNIKIDNSVHNLQWITNKENNRKAGRDGLKKLSKERILRLKEFSEIISCWYNKELNYTFTGSSMDLVRAFPEQKLDQGALSKVRSEKRQHHKNWRLV